MKMRHKVTIFVLIVLAAITILPSQSRLGGKSVCDKPVGMDIEPGAYVDGVYTGEATGFRPGLDVEIEIKNGELIRVSVIDHNEIGRQFWQRPIDLIPKVILDEQQTEVDAVGGATSTSHGIMAAVEHALEKAAI